MIVLVPVIDGLAAFAVFLAFLGCVMVLFAYRSTIGALLTWCANELDGLSVGALGVNIDFGSPIANVFTSANNAVLSALGTAVSSTEYVWHKLLHWLASCIIWIGQVVALDMHEVGSAFSRLIHVTIPRMAASAVSVAEHPLRFAQAQLKRDLAAAESLVNADVSAVKRDAQALERAALSKLATAESDAKGAATAAVSVVLPGIRTIDRDVADIKAWIKANEHTLTKAGIVGLVSAALAELGLGSQSCRNNKALSKGVCGLSSKVLDDLLAGLFAIVGTVSLVELATEYKKLFPDIASEALTFWRKTGAGTNRNPALGDTGL